MKFDIIKMAIKEMDHIELMEKFNRICAKGGDGVCMLEFLQHVIPQYETTKRELLTHAIEQAFVALTDQMWEDPLDRNVYSHMSELKKIANYLNINIDGGTN